MGEVIQFVPRSNPNRGIVQLATGMPAQRGDHNDPRNPNVSDRAIYESSLGYLAPEHDPA